MPNLDNGTIELIFIALTAIAVLAQAIVLLAMFLAVRKASHTLIFQIEELRLSVTPLVDSSLKLITRVGPQVEGTVADVAEIARGLRVQAAEMEATAANLIERVNEQANRIDVMFTSLLDGVERVGDYVTETVSRPVRQFSGLLAATKAIIESLRHPASARRETRTPVDRDTFV
jgi:hypothetical protein